MSIDFTRYTDAYLEETGEIVNKIDRKSIVKTIEILSEVKSCGGRLFILGVGGSAANASHAVNDFRKIAGIETYAPTDNVAELTARTNDEGWHTTFDKWLEVSKLSGGDALLILSVGGGSDTTSLNIKRAVDLALTVGAKVTAIVSRDGGYAAKHANACVLVPVVASERITPHAEGWQGVVWHLVVNAIAENVI
jgi:D-sedoheptulose 7-phosphate isomerase